MRRLRSRKIKSLFVASILLSHTMLLPSTAQASVVVVVGQPNVWSLEQAHYLLARIRERNFGLRNKSLEEADLDPNAANATRMDALRSVLEAGVGYNQGVGLNNALNRQNLEFNQTRRQELFSRRSQLFDDKSRLLANIGTLNAELSALEETAANAEAIKQKKRDIKAVEDELAAKDRQIQNLTAELELVGGGSTAVAGPSPEGAPDSLKPLTDRLAKTITDDFQKEAAKNPRLTASTKLDNYIQMQYELLAKQLTLLRDEVGPGERLIFLELPTSIYATPRFDNDVSVKSVWKVAGYFRENRFAVIRRNLDAQIQNRYAQFVADRANQPEDEQLRLQSVYDNDVRGFISDWERAGHDFYEERDELLQQGIEPPFATPDDSPCLYEGIDRSGRKPRVIDLIPRQSSLNVNDIREVVKERGFKFIFSMLVGIGGSINYQQRKDHFEQFQQQEVYAAGFGKGSATFGWVFNPAPGTKRLVPGVRTTYAVMTVPRDATRVVLQAEGLPFDTRSEISDSSFDVTADSGVGCTPVSATPTPSPTPVSRNNLGTFILEVPNGPNSEGFFVRRIDYPTVKIDHPSVVVLTGVFSNQTGVLVNGIPLTRTVGLASPWLGSDRTGSANTLGPPDTTVKGFYEVINSRQLILSFLMPSGWKGTPKITLISPNRARTLNDIRLNINGTSGRLDDDYRVGSKPDAAALSIADVQVSPDYGTKIPSARAPGLRTSINLTLSGVKDKVPIFYYNADRCTATKGSTCFVAKVADSLFHFEVDLPFNLEKISMTVTQAKEIDTKQIENPLFAKAVSSATSYDPAIEENQDDDSVLVTLEGRRIKDLSASCATADDVIWQSRSDSNGLLLVSGLRASQNVVLLTDRVTDSVIASVVIRRRLAKPKKPTPGNTNSQNSN